MKKILCMILVAFSLLSFASCGDKTINTTMFMINAQAFELPENWHVKMEYDQQTFTLLDEKNQQTGKVVVTPVTQGATTPENYINDFDNTPTIEKSEHNTAVYKIYDETNTEYHYIKSNLDYTFSFEESVNDEYITVILTKIA